MVPNSKLQVAVIIIPIHKSVVMAAIGISLQGLVCFRIVGQLVAVVAMVKTGTIVATAVVIVKQINWLGLAAFYMCQGYNWFKYYKLI